MHPKRFLLVSGITLVLMGLLGFGGVLGPTAQKSIFDSILWFGSVENWAYLILGFIGLLAAFLFKEPFQRNFILFLGLVGILSGVYSLLGMAAFFGAALENPAHMVLHLIIGIWALWSSYIV